MKAKPSPRFERNGSKFELFMAPREDGLGNLMYKVTDPDATYLLKLYRRRWDRLQSLVEPWFARYLHRRTSGGPHARFESERDNINLWAHEGFDVCRLFDRPLPAGLEGPGLWMEYCPGRSLTSVLQDGSVSWDEKVEQLSAMAGEMSRRHARAVATGERRLLQKHGTADHILLFKDRRITIDLEGAFLPGYRMEEALVRELSGYLRSLRVLGERLDDGIDAFIAAYPERDLLRGAVSWGLHGTSLSRRLTRFQDQRRRGAHSKTRLLARLKDRLVPTRRGEDRLSR